MLQRFTSPTSADITAADTSQHTFPSGVAGVVYLRAGIDNEGTVTISGFSSTGGPPLAAGDWSPPIGPLYDFASLSYTFSNTGDVLHYLVLR